MVDLVLPDTNVWLDIVRARATSGGTAAPASAAQDAMLLSQLVADGLAGVGLLHVVDLECQRNYGSAVTTARNELRHTRKRLARLGVEALPPAALDVDRLLANDELVYEQLMAQAEMFEPSAEDQVRAEARWAQRRVPAHRGGSNANDSHTLEAALRISRGRAPGTTWLVTRNTSDFEEAGQLHGDLDPEYEAAGLRHGRSLRDFLADGGHLRP